MRCAPNMLRKGANLVRLAPQIGVLEHMVAGLLRSGIKTLSLAIDFPRSFFKIFSLVFTFLRSRAATGFDGASFLSSRLADGFFMELP